MHATIRKPDNLVIEITIGLKKVHLRWLRCTLYLIQKFFAIMLIYNIYFVIASFCVGLLSCNSTTKLSKMMQQPMVQQPNCTLIHAYNANSVPHPLGPYSSVVRVDNALYVSGVVAVDPKTEKLMVGGVEAETRKAMIYVKRVLEEAGSSLERIALVRLYVTNIGDAEKINNVYEEFVSAPYPARVMVEVRSLPLGAHIEIEAMALISASCRL